MVEGINTENDELIATELEYFINCHSCKLTVNYILEAVKDNINRHIISTFLTTHCSTKYNPIYCNEIIGMYFDLIYTNVFDLVANEKYICHYAIPLCEEPVFKQLKHSDYISEVLADKPDFIKNDDYIDNLY
jgi:hypothetical protein